ncbi:hypothetical protein SK128_021741 [Halocaridina rubra]|uniref:Cystatin domain-containing protein n=1 Tax=Halocaridina rubra TaxID=373956 RepID=A0AAN8WXR3_HALRR
MNSIMKVGGTSEPKPPCDEVQALLNTIRDKVEERVGRPFTKFELISYKTQIVAGMNYFAKIDIGDGIVHARVYRNLQQNVTLSDVQHPKAVEDAIDYF